MTSHLQRKQNYAALVILRLSRSSSSTTHLKSLHRLPVKVRSTYKIACLCCHCHSSTAPSYVTDMLRVKVRSTYKIACLCYHSHSSTAPSYVADVLNRKPSHIRITRSSSYTMRLLNGHAHSKAIFGDRSFLCFFFCLEHYSKLCLVCPIAVII